MSNKFPNKVHYAYEVNPSTCPNLTHGVWGGISPQNEIEMNFYIESNRIPSIVEQNVSHDGSLEQKDAYNEDAITITRHIHSRIIMNRDTARAVLEWLQNKIDILDMEDSDSTLSFHKKIKLEQ